MTIELMLCCNDYRNGQFADELYKIQLWSMRDMIMIIDAEGDAVPMEWLLIHRVLLFGDAIPDEENPTTSLVIDSCIRHQTWVGNWCWDSVHISEQDAVRLLNWLARQYWTITEAATRLWDRWGKLTVNDLDKCRYPQCAHCAGTGTTVVTSSPGFPEHGSIEQESCPECNGTGTGA